MLGATSRLTPKSVDMTTYVPENGEAAHLEIGTAFYSINGYDSEKIHRRKGRQRFLPVLYTGCGFRISSRKNAE